MADLLPGESLIDYEARIRRSNQLDQLQQSMANSEAAATQELAAKYPVPTTIAPTNIDTAARPYNERSWGSRVVGAPVDMYKAVSEGVGLPVSSEPVGGSGFIDRASRQTVSQIAGTPAGVAGLYGLAESGLKYATDKDPNATFTGEMFTPDGMQKLQQLQADKSAEAKRIKDDATPEEIAVYVNNYMKSEDGYKQIADYMTPAMRYHKLQSLEAHKLAGLAGTPDDNTYYDNALGIIGSAGIATPGAPTRLGGALANTALDTAYQTAYRAATEHAIPKYALRAAEMLTPITVPATKGTIAANAGVGLVVNDAIQMMTGQASLMNGDFDELYKEVAQKGADAIDQSTIAGPPTDPAQEAKKERELNWLGPLSIGAAFFSTRALSKHIYNIANNTPAAAVSPASPHVPGGWPAGTNTWAQSPTPNAQGLAATTTPTGNAGIPTPPVGTRSASGITTERGVVDSLAATIDESANIRREMTKITGDEKLGIAADVTDQSYKRAAGQILDSTAVNKGIFSNGAAIKSTDYEEFMRDMNIADRKYGEDFNKYLNANRELTVRRETVDVNREAMNKAYADLQANPKSLKKLQAYQDARQLYNDSVDDASVVGRHDYRADSNADLVRFIAEKDKDPFIKSIGDRAKQINREILDIERQFNLITAEEYKHAAQYPYTIRKVADYTSGLSVGERMVRNLVRGLDYTSRDGASGIKELYAGASKLEINKEASKEITKFANPIDAFAIRVRNLAHDIRLEQAKREHVNQLEMAGFTLKKEPYNSHKHGSALEVSQPGFTDKYIMMRDPTDGHVSVVEMPGKLAKYINEAPQAFGISSRIANFHRTVLQRGATGPMKGISSLVNMGMTSALSPYTMASGKVAYNPATMMKGLAIGVNEAARAGYSELINTVRSLALNTPLFHIINLTPNGAKVIDSFLYREAERMKTSFMKELESIGADPTALVHGLPHAGPDYVNQVARSAYGKGPLKSLGEAWAKTFESLIAGPRLAVVDNELSKLKTKYGTQDLTQIPRSEINQAIMHGRQLEGDYMRRTGNRKLQQALALIPYGNVTVQGNIIAMHRLAQAFNGAVDGLGAAFTLGKHKVNVEDLTVLHRFITYGILPKFLSIGLMSAAGSAVSNWYWGERTDQQRLRELHFPKKFEDFVGLMSKMWNGTPYKELTPGDFYVMRGPPDTSWMTDAVVEGTRALLGGTFDNAPNWYSPNMFRLLGRWAASAAGFDMPLLEVAMKIKDGDHGINKNSNLDKDSNYIGAHVQDIISVLGATLGTATHNTINTYVATKSPMKALKEFDAQMGITHPAPGVSDVPMLLDAPTRYTRSNTLMRQVIDLEKDINAGPGEFLKQIANKDNRRVPIEIGLRDLQNLKLIADTIHKYTGGSSDYGAYDKAFNSFVRMARFMDNAEARKQYDPQQRIELTQTLNRRAHTAAERKIAILTDLQKVIDQQYGDYLKLKGYSSDWSGINKAFKDALRRY